LAVLSEFPELQEFRRPRGRSRHPVVPPPSSTDAATPDERIANAYEEYKAALVAEILERISAQTADFFEQLVLDVLHAAGYGGRHANSTIRLGRSGDGGVDGVIREDELGLDLIYVQAKRWQNPVGRPEIQRFVGALQGQRGAKGVFLTTSTFSSDAVAYAESVTPRVVLVDGEDLAELMIDHGVGVTVDTSYELKKLDRDYLGDEEPPSELADPDLGIRTATDS